MICTSTAAHHFHPNILHSQLQAIGMTFRHFDFFRRVSLFIVLLVFAATVAAQTSNNVYVKLNQGTPIYQYVGAVTPLWISTGNEMFLELSINTASGTIELIHIGNGPYNNRSDLHCYASNKQTKTAIFVECFSASSFSCYAGTTLPIYQTCTGSAVYADAPVNAMFEYQSNAVCSGYDKVQILFGSAYGQIGYGDTNCLEPSYCQSTCGSASFNGGCDPNVKCVGLAPTRTCPACSTVGLLGDSYVGCFANPCSTNNGGCFTGVTCTPPVEKYLPVVCGPCPSGYTGNGFECTKINLCNTNNGGCDPRTTCSFSTGAVVCSACASGYVGSGLTGCFPNACLNGNNGNCDPLTVCTGNPSSGAATCGACPGGYSGTGATGCTAINYCASATTCTTTCVNTPGVSPYYGCAPAFIANTLKIAGSSTTTAYPLMTNGNGTQLSVNYQPPTGAGLYLSSIGVGYQSTVYYACLNGITRNPTTIPSFATCILPAGAGVGLSLSLTYCTSSATPVCASVFSSDTFSFPVPSFVAHSIRSFGGVPPPTPGVLYAANSLGESIQMSVMNMYLGAGAMVKYGAQLGYVCAIDTTLSTTTLLVCSTQPNGAGGPYNFTYIGPGVSVTSSDSYTYPSSPIITAVSGCSPDPARSYGTAQCPTAGGIPISISITGTLLLPPVAVFVNGASCPLLQSTPTSLTCTLPAGVGSAQSVVVASNQQFSRPSQALSYAAPSVLSIVGCAGSLTTTTTTTTTMLVIQGCPRYVQSMTTMTMIGNGEGKMKALSTVKMVQNNTASLSSATITLTGQDFGASGASILVGSFLCINTTHDSITPHNKLTCTLPAGTGLNHPIIVVQQNGLLSLSNIPVSISYSPCSPGTYVNGLNCPPCSAGTFSDTDNAATCLQCAAGTSSVLGASQCTPCPVGRYSGLGAMSCMNCSAGTFSDNPGAVSCTECMAGTMSSMMGASVCTQCGVGQYQGATGASMCASCALGYYAPVARLLQCAQCEAGSFSNVTGASTCNKCMPGYYAIQDPLNPSTACFPCDLGSYGTFAGQSSCFQCLNGQFSNSTAATTCSSCVAGSYQGGTSASSCRACPVGSFAASGMAKSCTPCPVGFYAPETGASACLQCPAGYYQSNPGSPACQACSIGTSSQPQAAVCTPCKVNEAAPAQGSLCSPCPLNTTSDSQRTRCSCSVGYYSIDEGVQGANISCVSCPVGASCSAIGVTFNTLSVSAGYWRADNLTLNFDQCLLAAQCPGGGALSCASGRTGPICALCQPGFNGDITSVNCQACPSASTSTALTVVFTFLILCALLFLFYLMLRGTSDVKAIPFMALTSTPTHGPVSTPDDTIAQSSSSPSPSGSVINSLPSSPSMSHIPPLPADTDMVPLFADNDVYETMLNKGEVLSTEAKSSISFTYNLKIVVSFLQIATSITSVSNIYWPSGFLTFLGVFNVVNLNIIPWTTVDCVNYFTYYEKLLVVALVPLAILLALVLLYLVPLYLLDRADYSDDSSRRQQRDRYRHNFMKLVLFSLFLLYPGVSHMVVSAFDCHNVDGTWYLIADFNLHCFDANWDNHLGYVIILLLVYPIGVPVFFFCLLFYFYRKGSLHKNSDVQRSLGFLYEAYNSSVWWFELVDMLHKFLLTCTIVFWPVSYQLPVAMFISTCYTVVIILLCPYIRVIDDRMHIMAQVEILLLLMSGLVMNTGQAPTAGSPVDILMSVLLIAVVCFLILLFIAHAVISVRKLLWARARRQQQQQTKEGQTLGGREGGGGRGASIRKKNGRSNTSEVNVNHCLDARGGGGGMRLSKRTPSSQSRQVSVPASPASPSSYHVEMQSMNNRNHNNDDDNDVGHVQSPLSLVATTEIRPSVINEANRFSKSGQQLQSHVSHMLKSNGIIANENDNNNNENARSSSNLLGGSGSNLHSMSSQSQLGVQTEGQPSFRL